MKTNRTEKEMLSELRAAQENFAALHVDGKSTQDQLREATTRVKALSRELGDFISAGAVPCKCGHSPLGMLKTPAYKDQSGVEHPALFEVGCVHCAPYLVERPDGEARTIDGKAVKVKRRSYSARAYSPADAVRKWNEQDLIEDTKFDFTPNAKLQS